MTRRPDTGRHPGRHPGCDCRRAARRGLITMMDRELLDSLVGRIVKSIVDALAPETIIPFGSAARGEMRSSGDPRGGSRRETLTFYSVGGRYPNTADESATTTKEEYHRAMDSATAIVVWAARRIEALVPGG